MVLRAKKYKDMDKLRKTRNAQRKRYFSKTAIYKPRRWTDIEDVIVLEHRTTDMEISKYIERSVKAIQVRRVKLKKMDKNNELSKVKQQLAIAVEQLKDTYAICFRNRDTLLHTPEHNIIGGIERDCAIALQQIKELNK